MTCKVNLHVPCDYLILYTGNCRQFKSYLTRHNSRWRMTTIAFISRKVQVVVSWSNKTIPYVHIVV